MLIQLESKNPILSYFVDEAKQLEDETDVSDESIITNLNDV